MSAYPGMFNYHAAQPIEKVGGMTVYHTPQKEREVEAIVKLLQPVQFTPEPVFAYGWWCPKCDAYHEETGECPYE